MSHGNSLSHRAPGSIGQRQTPGRVFPGKRMAGRLGADKVTTTNLEVDQGRCRAQPAARQRRGPRQRERPSRSASGRQRRRSGGCEITYARDRAMKVKVAGSSRHARARGRDVRRRVQRVARAPSRHGVPGRRALRHESAEDPRRSRGGGKKPWKQKGTGRARAGTIRSPIWVGGGRAFAARPRSFEQKVNRKMYRAAMRSVLSELLRQERLVVTPEFALSAAKTKELKRQARHARLREGPRSSSKRST